jgi:hypothetical protein
MKAFNEFYLSSKRIFWAVNFGFAIAVILLIGFSFNFPLREILIQLGIGIVMTFVLAWICGGYNQIRQNYLRRHSKDRS